MADKTAQPMSGLKFESILESSPDSVAICDLDDRLVWCNPAFALAADGDVLPGKPLRDLLHLYDPKATLRIAPGERQDIQLLAHDGHPFWAEMSVTDADGFRTIRLRDVDKRRRNEDDLSYRESVWRHALVASRHGVWDVHIPTDRRFFSEEWRVIRGIPLDEELNDSLEDWVGRVHPDDQQAVLEHSQRNNSGEITQFTLEYRERHRNGHWIWIFSRGRATEWDENGLPIRYTGTDVDITALKEEEAQRSREAEERYRTHLRELEHARAQAEDARRAADRMSRLDPLTELANRRAFSERMDELTSSLATLPFALILIDLDRFKPVNDIHGHIVGDEVICEVARRLAHTIGDRGMIARLGGDEFGVILYGQDDEDIETISKTAAECIIKSISQPMRLRNRDIRIGASAGIALFPRHGDATQRLYRAADIAMYEVKNGDRGDWAAYSHEIDQRHASHATGQTNLHDAVVTGRIEPHFQPILDLADEQIMGFEILARWHDPEAGPLPPSFFIPRAEQQGLMKELTLSILRKACTAAADWPGAPVLNLNVSARDFCDPGLPRDLLRTLDRLRFNPARLGVEITESALLGDLELAREVSKILRAEGVRVLLDDFGTGFSGLDYLRRLDLDEIKIDRSFVIPMFDAAENEAAVRAVLHIAQQFGMATVAEGVETRALHDWLKAAGCHHAQGFLYGAAMPAHEARDLLISTGAELRTG